MSWPETEQERLTRIADEWMEECTEWCFEGNRQDLESQNAALWAFVKATDDYMRLINRKADIRAAAEAAERVLHARAKLRYYESEGDQ